MRRLAIAILLLGCAPPEGRFACANDSMCPLGWHCAGGLCYSVPTDAPSAMDTPDDVGRDAPGADVPTSDVATSDAPDVATDRLDAPELDAPELDAPCGAPDDPDHCGTCDRVCPAVAHGTRACIGGTCTASCDAPYALVLSPTTGAPRCTQFGGLYVEGAACTTPNPFTAGCSCPSGFEDRDMSGWLERGGDPTSRVHVCEVSAPVIEDAWGGVFVRNETLAACISGAGNRLVSGMCRCPTGFGTSTSQMIGVNSADSRLVLGFCRRGATDAGGTLGAAYSRVDTASAGCVAGTCVSGIASCACPAATFAVTGYGPSRGVGATDACDTESTYCIPTF